MECELSGAFSIFSIGDVSCGSTLRGDTQSIVQREANHTKKTNTYVQLRYDIKLLKQRIIYDIRKYLNTLKRSSKTYNSTELFLS